MFLKRFSMPINLSEVRTFNYCRQSAAPLAFSIITPYSDYYSVRFKWVSHSLCCNNSVWKSYSSVCVCMCELKTRMFGIRDAARNSAKMRIFEIRVQRQCIQLYTGRVDIANFYTRADYTGNVYFNEPRGKH